MVVPAARFGEGNLEAHVSPDERGDLLQRGPEVRARVVDSPGAHSEAAPGTPQEPDRLEGLAPRSLESRLRHPTVRLLPQAGRSGAGKGSDAEAIEPRDGQRRRASLAEGAATGPGGRRGRREGPRRLSPAGAILSQLSR